MKRSILAIAIISTISSPLFAEENLGDSKWVFRGTVAYVAPNDDSGSVFNNDGVSVDSSLALGLSFTYMMDENWGIEILAATPFSHDITGTGDLDGFDFGEVKQLPPTVSLTYHWGDTTTYHIGAGINYTKFFDEKSFDISLVEGGESTPVDLHLDASTGFSVQFGFDTPISENWNFTSVVYYKDIDTTADVSINGINLASVDVQIDPIVWTVGVSTRF